MEHKLFENVKNTYDLLEALHLSSRESKMIKDFCFAATHKVVGYSELKPQNYATMAKLFKIVEDETVDYVNNHKALVALCAPDYEDQLESFYYVTD